MITLRIFPDGAVFDHGGVEDLGAPELDALLEERRRGRIAPGKYLAALRDLVAREPDYIDGHAHLGAALHEQGKTRLALGACLAGLAIGRIAIPKDYEGPITWGILENRPFLRAAIGAAVSSFALRQHRDAIGLIEEMLRWNPDDHQGMRWLLGSSYLRAGRIEDAAQVFRENPEYPPYHYELGLLEIGRSNYVAAATSLRLGFAANPYIAEMLCGMAEPLPLAICHPSNLAEPDTARDYVRFATDLWERTPPALIFLRWLHTHPKIMVERAGLLAPREALRWEDDPAERRKLLETEDAALAAIDDTLSREIIVRRVGIRGVPLWPWEARRL